MRKDICCIGHITLDKIITPKLEKYMPVGPPIILRKVYCIWVKSVISWLRQ